MHLLTTCSLVVSNPYFFCFISIIWLFISLQYVGCGTREVMNKEKTLLQKLMRNLQEMPSILYCIFMYPSQVPVLYVEAAMISVDCTWLSACLERVMKTTTTSINPSIQWDEFWVDCSFWSRAEYMHASLNDYGIDRVTNYKARFNIRNFENLLTKLNTVMKFRLSQGNQQCFCCNCAAFIWCTLCIAYQKLSSTLVVFISFDGEMQYIAVNILHCTAVSEIRSLRQSDTIYVMPLPKLALSYVHSRA